MTKKRFELIPNLQGQVDIIDHVESEEKNAICIYNDLGVLPFTSAPSLCDLLNELNDKCDFLEIENEVLEDGATKYAELYHKLLKENEQLKKGMIGVVNRYIKNVDCNPPSSTHTYMKIKGALLNIREDLRDLLEDLE